MQLCKDKHLAETQCFVFSLIVVCVNSTAPTSDLQAYFPFPIHIASPKTLYQQDGEEFKPHLTRLQPDFWVSALHRAEQHTLSCPAPPFILGGLQRATVAPRAPIPFYDPHHFAGGAR